MDSVLEIVRAPLEEAATILIVAVVGYVVVLLRSGVKSAIARTEGFLDENARQRLEVMFDNAISALEAEGKAITVDDVLRYAKRFNPGDLDRLKLEGDRLVSRVKTAIKARSASGPVA